MGVLEEESVVGVGKIFSLAFGMCPANRYELTVGTMMSLSPLAIAFHVFNSHGHDRTSVRFPGGRQGESSLAQTARPYWT
jgi:hypothetical protein